MIVIFQNYVNMLSTESSQPVVYNSHLVNILLLMVGGFWIRASTPFIYASRYIQSDDGAIVLVLMN